MAAALFFFYGTLLAGSDNPAARVVHARLRPVGPASVRGALWAIREDAGWYPALVAQPGGRVAGQLYRALPQFGPDDLARLDEWEDYHSASPARSLYLRVAVTATRAGGGRVGAQAYRYDRPLPPSARRIARGDFRRWLGSAGLPALRG